MSIKYLSPSGLTEVWSNIKAYIASKIPSKIITGLSIKGRTITYTNSDGTTGTLTTQDTNTTYSVATTSTNGLMSSTDKTKLDGIAAGANNYTHPSSHPASMITGLTKVATSGSYNDLTNKPTIPTVNNATLTIQKNGTTVKTFTANASANVTANITVPTKTSELTNNSGFLTSHNPVDSSLSSTSTNAIQNKVVNAALNNKANDSDVVHKSGTETIVGTKTFSSQIKGNISGTSSNVVVGSDTATARGYLVDNNLPWYTWEEGSPLIAGRVPLITDFNNLTKPGVYHVVFCLNDGFVHEGKEYKETLNRPSLPGGTTNFRDGILEIKQTRGMNNISSVQRFIQKLTVLSGIAAREYNNLTYQRVGIMYSPSSWTAWKRVARDEEVVHTSGDETIVGVKTFTSDTSVKINLQNTRMVNDQDDTVNRFWSIGLTDKNGNLNSRILRYINADNSSAFQFNEYYRGVSNNAVIMGPGHTQDGQGYVFWNAGIKNNTYPLTNNTYTLGTSTLKWKAVYANTFNGNLVGNADTATKATQDAAGNVITTTYAKDANVVHKSGNETIAGLKTFDYWQIINMGLNVKWITGNKEQKSLHLFASMNDKYEGCGSELKLYGDDANYGKFILVAQDKTKNNVKIFIGLPDGTLTWDGKKILTEGNGVTVDTNQTITGEKTFSKTIHVENLTNYPGHNLWVYAGDLNATYSKVNNRYDGTITINCVNATTKKSSTMDLKPDGTFTWNGGNVLTDVKGVTLNTAQTISGNKTFTGQTTFIDHNLLAKNTTVDLLHGTNSSWVGAGITGADKNNVRIGFIDFFVGANDCSFKVFCRNRQDVEKEVFYTGINQNGAYAVVDNRHIVRTVNGVGANQAGNVTISTVANATKATQDSAGQQINTTYIKGVSVSGRTVTFTRGNDTTFAITIHDNVIINSLANSFGTPGVGGICFVSGRTRDKNIGGLGADVAGSDICLVHWLGITTSGKCIDIDYDTVLSGTWRLLGSVSKRNVNAILWTLAIRIA